MQNKSLLILLFLWSGIIGTHAQQIFSPGFLINNNGDTLRGVVLDAAYEVQSKQVTFKRDENAKSEVYKPAEIRGFALGNTYYKAHQVVYSEKVRGTTFTRTVSEMRFLRQIENGTIELFKLDISDINYVLYVSKNGAPLEQLFMVINTVEGIEGSKQSKILSSDTVTRAPELIRGDYVYRRFYYATLQQLTGDCPKLANQPLPELKDNLIAKFIQKYNKTCGISTTITNAEARKNYVLHLIVGGGGAGKSVVSAGRLTPPLSKPNGYYNASVGIHFNNNLESKRLSQELRFNLGGDGNAGFFEVQARINTLLRPANRLSPYATVGMGFARRYGVNTFVTDDRLARLLLAVGIQYSTSNRIILRAEAGFPDLPGFNFTVGLKL
jgi:hypothetical protein